MLDAVDLNILRILQRDCTVSVADIAQGGWPFNDAMLAAHSKA